MRRKPTPSALAKPRKLSAELLEERRLLALDTLAGSGIQAQYFSDANLETFVAAQNETGLSLDWGTASPLGSLNPDQFSARFNGQIEARFTETHNFTLSADGGVRLWINGIKVIDRWNDSLVANASASVDLISGRRYDIQLEYRETTGPANLDLKWSAASLPIESIPTSQLFAGERGTIERRVYSNISGSQITNLTSAAAYPNSPTSVSTLANFEVVNGAADNYGQSISGLLHPSTTGEYEFYIAGDETAELWLSNAADPSGSQRIALVSAATTARNWTASPGQQSASITLVAGQSYAIQVLHKESTGPDHVAVGWKRPGSSSIEVIDSVYLSPGLPIVRVYSQISNAFEGSTNALQFLVQRSGGVTTNALTVNYNLRGTATAGIDYAAQPGTIVIPAGQRSAVLSIPTLTDALTEGTETLLVEIVDGPGYDVGLISERRSIGSIQDDAPAPVGGTLASQPMVLGNYSGFGGSFASFTPTAPRTAAFRATINTAPALPYNAQLRAPISTAIAANDILLMEFFVRSTGANEGSIAVIFENNTSYAKSIEQGITVPTSWTRIQVPFLASESYAAGAATYGFFLGFKVQTLEFADIRLINYGSARDLTPTNLFLNNIGGNYGSLSTVNLTGQPFSTAAQIVTSTVPPNSEAYRLQYGGRNPARVSSGNNLQVEFYARSTAGTNPRILANVQRTDTYSTLASQLISLTSVWQKYTIDVTVGEAFASNGLQFFVNAGYGLQTVQVGGLKWTNLSANYNLSDLPQSTASGTYGGRSGNDAWRDTAEADINTQRQSMLTVNVVDAYGNPVDGAVVSLQQKKHEFKFGTAIDGQNGLLDSNGNQVALKYQSEIERLFNTVVIENSMKWPGFQANRQNGIDYVAWAVQRDLYVRGHNAVWPSRQNMPSSIWSQYDSLLASQGATAAANFLRTTIEMRIQDAASTFAGIVGDWDVVNEPFTNNDVMSILGNQIVVDWYTQFKVYDPNGQRTLNDYSIFANNGNNTAHRANFDYWLTLLSNANAIERIGEQSHYSESNLTDITTLRQLIQTYHNQYNLPISITEFDVNIKDRQLQADYLRDYLSMSFSQGGVDQFLQWGFWDQKHWLPEAALLNADFSLRPHAQVYEDLVFGSWWTDTRATSRGGSVSQNVFEGDYEITVSYNGATVTRSLEDFKANSPLTINLPGVIFSQTQVSGTEGVTSNVTAVLSQQPTADVVVSFDPNSQVALAPNQLTFTSVNWNVPQIVNVTPIDDFIIEGAQVATLTSYAASTDARFQPLSSEALSIQFVDGLAPLKVTSVTISDGTNQRSIIREVVVDFDGLADISPGAFSVLRYSAAGDQAVDVNAAAVDFGSITRVTLTFSGTLTQAATAGLIDGNYRLIVDASKVKLRGTNGILDGDSDGSAGGNYTFGAALPDRFFALLGDGDGDGVVSLADMLASRTAYGKTLGESGFRPAFDFNNDQTISLSDYLAVRTAYGRTRQPLP